VQVIIGFVCFSQIFMLKRSLAIVPHTNSALRKIMKYLYFVIIVFSLPIQGATILSLGTKELVNKSEIVFEGEVISTRSEMNKQGRIYTFVKFHVRDVIVGNTNTGDQLELRFTGGIVDGHALDVGVRIPKEGESGIYFVERVRVGLINPLLGWDQGHFTIRNDGKVIASNSQPVFDIKNSDYSPSLSTSQGVAKGIITSKLLIKKEPLSSAMTVEQFKSGIRSLVND
jgi:hypothetical protein